MVIKQLSTAKESHIPRELPPDLQIANKTGDLDGIRNDCGIVFVKNRRFAISVMTAYDRGEHAAERMISDIALQAYRYFEMQGKMAPYRRIVQ